MARRLDDLPPPTPLPPPEDDGGNHVIYRRRRPKIVGAIGWICAGLGYASFIMKGSQLPSLFVPEKLQWINPDWKPLQLSPRDFSIVVMILLAEMLVGLISIAGGIGCLKLREWGRKLAILYGITSILTSIAKSTWQFFMFDFMLDYQISMTTQPVDRAMAANKEYLALVMISGVQLIWPLIVISILTRRHIKDAFLNLTGSGESRAELWESSRPG